MQMRMRVLMGTALLIPVAALVQANQSITPPAGLKFRVRFTQAIDSASVTAGDRIRALLRTGIRGVAPEGSAVTARIVEVERVSGKKPVFRMEARIESVDVRGVAVALKAEASPKDSNRFVMPQAPLLTTGSPRASFRHDAPLNQPRIGQLRDAPAVFVWEFQVEKTDFVVPAGLESSWVTAQ